MVEEKSSGAIIQGSLTALNGFGIGFCHLFKIGRVCYLQVQFYTANYNGQNHIFVFPNGFKPKIINFQFPTIAVGATGKSYVVWANHDNTNFGGEQSFPTADDNYIVINMTYIASE